MPNTKLVFEYLINQNMEPLDFKLCMLIHHTESDNDGYVYIDEAEWSKKVKKSLRTIQRSFNTLSTQGVILKDYTPRPNCPKKKGTPLYVKLLLPKHLTQKLTPPEPYIPTCEIESITLNLAQSAALKGVLLTKRSLYQILTIYKGYNVDEAHKAVERLITVGELEFSSESDTLAPKITGVILQLKTNKIIKVLEEKFFTKDKSKKSFFELVEFCFGKNKDFDAKGKVGKVINYSIPHSQDKDSQERVKKNYRPLEEIIKRVVDNAHYHGCVLTHTAIQEYCFIYRSIPKEKTDRVLKDLIESGELIEMKHGILISSLLLHTYKKGKPESVIDTFEEMLSTTDRNKISFFKFIHPQFQIPLDRCEKIYGQSIARMSSESSIALLRKVFNSAKIEIKGLLEVKNCYLSQDDKMDYFVGCIYQDDQGAVILPREFV